MKKNRDELLDSIKGIAIILVVLRHVIQGGSADSDTVLIANIIFAIQMPLFMILSGYFGCKNYRNEFYKKEELIDKLKRITISYMIPFLSFFFICKVIIQNQYLGGIDSLINQLLNDITISLWYLFVVWVLGIILTVSFFVSTISNKNNNKSDYLKSIKFVVCYITLLVPIVVIMYFKSTSFLGTKLILYYSIFYLIGYLVKCFKIEIKNFLNKVIIKCKLIDIMYAVCLFVFAILVYNFTFLNMEDNLLGISIRIISALSGIYILTYICYMYKDKLKNTMLAYIGKNTLEIYYVHSLLVRIMDIDNNAPLFTIKGFFNSSILLLMLSLFTYIIIITVKSNKITNFIIFGKRSNITEY